jgi:V8-like Glu-specific endopeptidase
MKLTPLALSSLLLLPAANVFADPFIGIMPIIYGVDNRKDIYAATDDVKKLADSSTALFYAWNVKIDKASHTANLVTEKYGDRLNLADSERFHDQPSGAYCSGALVGPDLVLTAGHCVSSELECKAVRFVFGYAIQAKGSKPTTVPESDVYSCKEVVKSVPESTTPTDLAGFSKWFAGRTVKADWAIVRLDREAPGRKPLEISDAKMTNGNGVFVIGYPSGLPAKVAAGATVTDDSGASIFKADLDTYAGNSGSPVFDSSTNKIVGVLVRGNNDFLEVGVLAQAWGSDGVTGMVARVMDAPSLDIQRYMGTMRNVSNVMPQGTKDAETVTRADAFKPTLGKALADKNYVEPGLPKDSANGLGEAFFHAAAGELGSALAGVNLHSLASGVQPPTAEATK